MKSKIAKIIKCLAETGNYDFSGYSLDILERRIGMRFLPTQSSDFDEYYHYLITHKEETELLMQALTIKVSHFFRNPLDFEILGKIIDNYMINKHENNEPLRIWSAGCATGEEPYSIAILVAESYFNENTDTEIFATDIDANVLEQAKAGEYHPDSIKEVKYGLLKKYFVEKADTFVVVEKIRKMVEFSFHDQLGSRNTVPRDSIYGDFDLVLCRNVMIYYDHRQREIIMQRLFNSLRYGGYLILGESEEISARFSSKCRQVAPASKIFKKILK